MVLDELVSTLYRKYDKLVAGARNYIPKPRYLFSAGLATFVLGHGDMNKASAEIKVDEYQVTNALYNQGFADISERYIVWGDYRNGVNTEIYGYDMGLDGEFGTGDDNGEFRITNSPGNKYYPKISKGYVVYQTDEFDGRFDIGLTKIVNGIVVGSIFITKYGAAQRYPYIYVDSSDNIIIIWQDNRNGLYGDENIDNDNWDIYKWESTGSWDSGIESRVTTNACDQLSPAVWFDETNIVITWKDSRNYDCNFDGSETDVYVKIDSNPEFEIGCIYCQGERSPIDGDFLVYSSYRNGSFNIMLYNWKTMTETLFDKPGWQEVPDISNDIVVYEEGNDIYGRFISSGEEFRVTNDLNYQWYPVVYKVNDITNIVWMDNRNIGSGWDIYGARIYELPASDLVGLIILGGILLGAGYKKLRKD